MRSIELNELLDLTAMLAEAAADQEEAPQEEA